ncbi:cation diffusion facilitator CzcD-associated flavoprotein CzcO [Actinomadura luteofluorescens]|uniref:Cation diffusion facilitator CzcD-associated flavoprotein CzcO n=2 Tax=Actinomadura luteofluorescens TaxID=46163 RepID=A0A7Y9EBJ1_9ACTN|nr:ArsO family NAD(P)H-dependent flavin-containing monooxygenase [Actinomadura luteofluorescens]NYD44734.1 cation diffusion facilitator CzcD-associated flavoprotein CzcO [Actinomadura luteofluorescens]
MSADVLDVAVIGGGQAGSAAGFYLRRSGVEFAIFDAQDEPGGAWPHMWASLRLFSPARYSSLPGRPMPPWNRGYPPAAHVVDYLTAYEKRYELPIHRPVRIEAVHRDGDLLRLDSATASWRARHVISATGTWWSPYLPYYPGRGDYQGRQLHTVQYHTPEDFHGQRVVVVGGGNSAAQITADLASQATTIWTTPRPPRFLPDDLDGRALFELASRRLRRLRDGHADSGGIGGLGDIVAVPAVRDARDRGLLHAQPMFDRLTATGIAWRDGRTEDCDAIIWCTGFRPALSHLTPLGLRDGTGHIPTGGGTRALAEPRLHLLGYGDWTGPGSATLVGAGRTARDAVRDITSQLAPE